MKTLYVLIVSTVLSTVILLGGVALTPMGLTTLPALLSAWTMPLNTNPPAYIKDVVAYKEGDGMVLYLTLADTNGAFTRAGGVLVVDVTQPGKTVTAYERYPITLDPRTVWSYSHQITADQFQTATVGRGPFERSIVLLSLGRISVQRMTGYTPGETLTVNVRFMTNGQWLTGSCMAWL